MFPWHWCKLTHQSIYCFCLGSTCIHILLWEMRSQHLLSPANKAAKTEFKSCTAGSLKSSGRHLQDRVDCRFRAIILRKALLLQGLANITQRWGTIWGAWSSHNVHRPPAIHCQHLISSIEEQSSACQKEGGRIATSTRQGGRDSICARCSFKHGPASQSSE